MAKSILRGLVDVCHKVDLRRPGKSDHSVAKLSYGGGMRRIDRRSWILDQAWIGEGLEFGLPERKAQHVMERSEVECGA